MQFPKIMFAKLVTRVIKREKIELIMIRNKSVKKQRSHYMEMKDGATSTMDEDFRLTLFLLINDFPRQKA